MRPKLGEVPGIGKVRLARLNEAGILSVEDLAASEPGRVAQIKGFTESMASSVILAARAMLEGVTGGSGTRGKGVGGGGRSRARKGRARGGRGRKRGRPAPRKATPAMEARAAAAGIVGAEGMAPTYGWIIIVGGPEDPSEAEAPPEGFSLLRIPTVGAVPIRESESALRVGEAVGPAAGDGSSLPVLLVCPDPSVNSVVLVGAMGDRPIRSDAGLLHGMAAALASVLQGTGPWVDSEYYMGHTGLAMVSALGDRPIVGVVCGPGFLREVITSFSTVARGGFR